jgi:hypothetical protein
MSKGTVKQSAGTSMQQIRTNLLQKIEQSSHHAPKANAKAVFGKITENGERETTQTLQKSPISPSVKKEPVSVPFTLSKDN